MTTRTFLITGASKGIGRALAERLAAGGHRVIGLARGESPDFPGQLINVDLADRAATAATLAALAGCAIDGVVNNVGLVRPQRLGEIGLENLDAVLDLRTCLRRQMVGGSAG